MSLRKVLDCCYEDFEEFLVYTTKKELRVKNRFIGVVNFLGMLIIATYVVVYTIVLDKGYQEVGLPTGYVATKVKGVAFNATDLTGSFDKWSFFESVDLVQPAIEIDGLFLPTALVHTWQKRGICDGEDECDIDDNCTAGAHDYNGVNTGDCLDGYCQQWRYCPAENDTITISDKLLGVENFTIFLKVSLEFKDFEVDMINTEDQLGTGELIEGYNLFTVSDILDESGVSIDDIQETGAIINGDIEYHCNFDYGEACHPYPKFSWYQEDVDEDSVVSSGFDFHKVFFSLNDNKTMDRLLVRYHGIRFRFSILGEGGKFAMQAFSTTLGSGIALTAISALITEFLLRHCIPERTFYTKKRMEIVTIAEEEEWMRTSSLNGVEMAAISDQDLRSISESPELQSQGDSPMLNPSGGQASIQRYGLNGAHHGSRVTFY